MSIKKYSIKVKNIVGRVIIFFIIIWVFLIFIWRPNKIRGRDCDCIFSMEHHGFCVIPKIFTSSECKNIEYLAQQNKTRELMRDFFGEGCHAISKIRERISDKTNNYTFHNYVWNIRKGSVITCHSDNNARRFNPNQKYPSYTVLIYPTGGCLGVIPQSHKSKYRKWFYFYNPVIDIVCDPGDIIIFDAELIHVGGTSCHQKENPRLQLKVSHKDDLEVLGYYQDYYKIIDKESKIPKIISIAQKNLSCMVPILSDMTQSENIKTSRGSIDGAKIGWAQKLFSLFIYGDANYYDLK